MKENGTYENGVHAIIFEGGEAPTSWPESLLLKVRLEVSRDILEMLLSIEEINGITLVSDYEEMLDFAKSHPLYNEKIFIKDTRMLPGNKLDNNAKNFHYGRVLEELIFELGLDKVLVCGGGSTPLVRREELKNVCRKLIFTGEKPLLYANNPQSGDIVAFKPGSAIRDMEPPSSDNALVMGLRYEVGLPFSLIPLSTGILFDLDTPAELFILLEDYQQGNRIKNLIQDLELEQSEAVFEGLKRLQELKKVLSGNYKDVNLIGRISGSMMTHVNENIKCRLRVFSEERGMKAMGRVEEMKVKSLLGYFIEEAGLDGFFNYLEALGKGCIIDSRVIFHHFGAGNLAGDRFYSDLFLPGEIKDDFVREFTLRAKNSKIPILLGGHSLVSGGLYALVEQILKGDNYK